MPVILILPDLKKVIKKIWKNEESDQKLIAVWKAEAYVAAW